MSWHYCSFRPFNMITFCPGDEMRHVGDGGCGDDVSRGVQDVCRRQPAHVHGGSSSRSYCPGRCAWSSPSLGSLWRSCPPLVPRLWREGHVLLHRGRELHLLLSVWRDNWGNWRSRINIHFVMLHSFFNRGQKWWCKLNWNVTSSIVLQHCTYIQTSVSIERQF